MTNLNCKLDQLSIIRFHTWSLKISTYVNEVVAFSIFVIQVKITIHLFKAASLFLHLSPADGTTNNKLMMQFVSETFQNIRSGRQVKGKELSPAVTGLLDINVHMHTKILHYVVYICLQVFVFLKTENVHKNVQIL